MERRPDRVKRQSHGDRLSRAHKRILGKLRACERRKKVFNPGVRLIADDLRMSRMTVWRRLQELIEWGLVVVHRAPPRGAGYLRFIWRTAAYYRGSWDAPPNGEYQSPQKQPRCQPKPLAKGPEGEIVLELEKLGARSQAPPGERRRRLTSMARRFVREGLTLRQLRLLVKSARRRAALVLWWLADPRRWRDVELEVLGRQKHEKVRRQRSRNDIDFTGHTGPISPLTPTPADEPEPRSGSIADLLGSLGFKRSS